LRSVVLINCGGTIDLAEFFSLNENTTIYVFDSHRPTHLNNLYESDNVDLFFFLFFSFPFQ